MARFIASAFRSSAALALLIAPAYAQDASAARLKTLEHTLRDYGGLLRYGSDDSELPAPKAGENRVIFLAIRLPNSGAAITRCPLLVKHG